MLKNEILGCGIGWNWEMDLSKNCFLKGSKNYIYKYFGGSSKLRKLHQINCSPNAAKSNINEYLNL